jgi:hypothetical protein
MASILDTFVHSNDLRYLHKDRNANERALFSGWYKEQLYQYGIEVNYFVNSYALSGHDSIYGEQPMQRFAPAKRVVLATTLNESAVSLAKFGIMSDDEVGAFIHIDAFYELFGTGEEPKAGDVFELEEYARHDRVGGRTGKVFEITERLDQDISEINPIMGHYIWSIKAKRFDHSFEPGAPIEGKMDQVYDGPFAGRLGDTDTTSPDKVYDDNADALGEKVFDYREYLDSDDSVYGGY